MTVFSLLSTILQEHFDLCVYGPAAWAWVDFRKMELTFCMYRTHEDRFCYKALLRIFFENIEQGHSTEL
jgi:hypothetical protein